MKNYQLIVIGSGPGGYVAAIRAAQKGLSCAIVERRQVGGTCLNRGCIPTKALLHSAEAYADCAKFPNIGLSVENVTYDMTAIHQRKAEVVSQLRGGVEMLLKANGVDLLNGNGRILSANEVDVDGTVYASEKILIATGSVPAAPPIPGLDLPGVVTSDEILEGDPIDYKSLVIIGGGVIGVELASFYADLGCKVSVVEMMDRILPLMDREISQNLNMILKKRGVNICTKSAVTSVTTGEAGLTVNFTVKEEAQSIEAEGVLVAIGRKPYTDGLFADGIAPEMDRRFIKVNERYETSIPGIYAIGDVIGGVQLAHKAEIEGQAAIAYMMNEEPATDPSVIPSCVYTSPEIASVGLTEDEAKTQGVAVNSAKYLMAGNGKSIIDLQDRGFIKVVTEAESGRLLGVHMMCGRASDLISEYAAAIANKLSYHDLLKGMRPHPSYCEGMTEALEALEGLSIHTMPQRKR